MGNFYEDDKIRKIKKEDMNKISDYDMGDEESIDDALLEIPADDEEYIKKIQELEKSDASLNELIPKYSKNIQLLEDKLQNKNYILFVVWSFIFILIFVSFLFALLDTNQNINLVMRVVIYIFIIYILYYIFNNVLHFIKKNV